jgi:CBS domain-containing protein
MGRSQRSTLRDRAVEKAAVWRSRGRRKPDLVDNLRERGEDAWAGALDALHDVRHALSGAARRRVPRAAKVVRGRGEWLAERVPSVHVVRREERSMLDKLLNRFTFGFGIGYVLGARAGRQRYEQLVDLWEKFAGSPVVRQAAQQAAEQGKQLLDEGREKLTGQLQARHRPERISEVMTPTPVTVRASQTVAEAANNMRQMDVGSMIVVDDAGKLVGMVTDRDIAVRAVAQGKDAQSTPVAEIISEQPATLSPTDSVEEAVRLMRDKAIRRLPVVEGDRPVGIVSIGDLAVDRDPRSALADISSEPPNR